jgi:nucleoside-diphosphate-sugar epimerase
MEPYTLCADSHIENPSANIAVTGGGGNIGSNFVRSAERHLKLHVIERPGVLVPEDIRQRAAVTYADIRDWNRMLDILNGKDTLVHFAAICHDDASWEQIYEVNIQGTRNAFNSAVIAGCKKIIFASSIHSVLGYPQNYAVKPRDPVFPVNEYGVSKCFGEAYGRYLSKMKPISFYCIRIGTYIPIDKKSRPDQLFMKGAFVSDRDLNQLINKILNDTKLRFAIFHGISMNDQPRMDSSLAHELLDYTPEDDFTPANPLFTDMFDKFQ